MRVAFEQIQPEDPLFDGTECHLPRIQVLIPCAAKDVHVLPATLTSIDRGVRNPVENITLLAPREDIPALVSSLRKDMSVSADEDQGLPKAMRAIEELVPQGRQAWVRQQVLKLAFVGRSMSEGVLVLDADTILLRPRTWLDNTHQVLLVAHEYHHPYVTHMKTCLGTEVEDEGISWVTHHQLMQPRIVRAMLQRILARSLQAGKAPEMTDFDLDLAMEVWIRNADFRRSSALSEYHTYGCFLRRFEPKCGVIARWSNIECSPSDIDLSFESISDRFDGYLSASLHSYMKR